MKENLTQPDVLGHWGPYGGRFVPETLVAPLDDLTQAFEAARSDTGFQEELDDLLSKYAGRPTPLFFA
ncbi:MAG: tryptophan synthase subunit beta, partial [Pyrinomonadaceae bacterium]